MSILVNDLFKVVIPNITQEIIQVQKKAKSTTQGEGLISSKNGQTGVFVNKDVHFKKDNYVSKSCSVTHFPFTIVVKSGQYDIVTNSYEDFRDLTRGLQCLIDQKANMSSNAKRVLLPAERDDRSFADEGEMSERGVSERDSMRDSQRA
jgi:hypothetical protein